MTDHTPEELAAIARGSQAREELALTAEAFAKVRAGLLEVIAKSAIGETTLREKVYMGVQVIDAMHKLLEEEAAGGVVADYNALVREALGENSPVV